MKKLSIVLSALAATTLFLGAAHITPAHAAPRCAEPSGYCPNGDLVPMQNPDATNVPQSYNPQVSTTTVDAQVTVSTDNAAAGDTVLFAGSGFTALGQGSTIYVNLVYANGLRLDTRSAAISCPTFADGTPVYYVDSWGEIEAVCSSGAAGQVITSDAAGNFIGAVRIPDSAPAGQAELCASSIFTNSVCAPITVD